MSPPLPSGPAVLSSGLLHELHQLELIIAHAVDRGRPQCRRTLLIKGPPSHPRVEIARRPYGSPDGFAVLRSRSADGVEDDSGRFVPVHRMGAPIATSPHGVGELRIEVCDLFRWQA